MFTSYRVPSPISLPRRRSSRRRGRGWAAVPVASEAVHPRRKGTGVLTPKPFLDRVLVAGGAPTPGGWRGGRAMYFKTQIACNKAVLLASEAVHPRRKGTGVLTPKPFLHRV